MGNDRTRTQPRGWEVLRRRFRDGNVGGPNDGDDSDGDDEWSIEYECAHGATEYRAPVETFLLLLAAINVAAYEHSRVFRRCRHVYPGSDRVFARIAIDAWREAFGADPDVFAS